MRLIDADELIKCLDYCAWNDATEVVNAQPTAYDVEKVVEVVREDCYSMGFDESQTEIIVDEVKKGGVL